jgi:hypothetical protein
MTSPNPLRLTVIDYEPIPNVTAEQAGLATRRVAEHAHDADDARLLLDILFGKVQVKPPRGFSGREPRDSNALQPCGTEARYQYHRKHDKPVDAACQKAASKSRVEGQRRLRARRKAEAEAKEAA